VGPAPPATAATLAAGQYRTEAEARAACGTDPVVWGNSESKVFHPQGGRFYGRTQQGAYMCTRQATAAGYRAAR
jgi:hypothetical protein